MATHDINEIVLDFSRVYILTILYERPVHGYEIISRFRSALGKDVSPSLVYPFLKQLEDKGLVKHSMTPVGAKKRRCLSSQMKVEYLPSNCLNAFPN